MSTIEKIAKLIKKGNTDKLGEYLQDPSLDINELDPKSGKTLLQIAIESQQKQAFQQLLKTKGIKLDTVSKQGQTALQTTILMNSPIFLESLLRACPQSQTPRKSPKNRPSPLYTAIKNKSTPQIIFKLIFHGYDVNQPVQRYGSLMNLAIACDQVQAFGLLIGSAGVDLRVVDEQGRTGLLGAVQGKKGEFVQAILKKLEENDPRCIGEMQKQFYLNSCNSNGDTALHIAARKNYQTILQTLLKHGQKLGLDPTIKNKQGKTYKELSQEAAEALQKQRQQEEYQEKKRIEERRIKNREKEEERVRLAKEQEIMAAAERKRKKEEQALEATRREMSVKLERNRKIWVLGIAAIIVVGVLYLLFLNAASAKPKQNTNI